jgi:hypothetical protein
VVNGDGRNTLNRDDKVALYGRLTVSPTGDYGYAEGDLDSSDHLASTLGLAFHYQPDLLGTFFDGGAGTDPVGDLVRLNLDGGLKYRGGSLQGEVSWSELDPGQGPNENVTAWYLQGGWFVRPAHAEVVARASRVLVDGDDDDVSEYTLGFNLFTAGNRLKWQAAYSWLDDKGADFTHHRVLGQAQIWF